MPQPPKQVGDDSLFPRLWNKRLPGVWPFNMRQAFREEVEFLLRQVRVEPTVVPCVPVRVVAWDEPNGVGDVQLRIPNLTASCNAKSNASSSEICE